MGKKANESYSFINLIAVVACFGVIVVILSVLLANFMFEKAVDPGDDVSEGSGDVVDTSSGDAVSQTETSDESGETDVSKEDPGLPSNYETVKVPYSDIHKGDLIVVNNNQKYDFANTPILMKIYNYQDYTSKVFKLRDLDIQISFDIISPLNSMLGALNAFTGSNALTVTYGFRSEADQAERYSSGKDTDMAGGSELNTGLAFMCTVFPAEEGSLSEGRFAWLAENCDKYGFVLRYPAGKKSLTLHDGSDSLFRYVGRPHAFLMKLNNQCLEEYIDFCKRFTYDNPFSIISDGKRYYIYYVKANTKGETEIKIPENCDYTLSGDNSEGFIVTVMAGNAE